MIFRNAFFASRINNIMVYESHTHLYIIINNLYIHTYTANCHVVCIVVFCGHSAGMYHSHISYTIIILLHKLCEVYIIIHLCTNLSDQLHSILSLSCDVLENFLQNLFSCMVH